MNIFVHTSITGDNHGFYCFAMLIVGEDGPWLIPNSLGGDTFTPDPSPDTSDNTSVRALQHRIGENDRIIMVKKKWLQIILDEIKFLEIRPVRGTNVIGKRIFLCESGTGGMVFGHAFVEAVQGPLSDTEWEHLRHGHRVSGTKMYKHTYAWTLSRVTRLTRPLRIIRKRGAMGIQKGP